MKTKQSTGGSARAAKLTPAERKRIAQDAAKKRWEGKGKKVAPIILHPEMLARVIAYAERCGGMQVPEAVAELLELALSDRTPAPTPMPSDKPKVSTASVPVKPRTRWVTAPPRAGLV